MVERLTYNRKSCPCIHRGQWLDSLLELRFILSIEETHAWVRDGLEIFFTIDEVPEGVKGGLSSYTPDFLIRNVQTGKATLVEVKPESYTNKWELLRRKEIAENFIRQFGYDWDFSIIYSNQITLSQSALQKYQQLLVGFPQGVYQLPPARNHLQQEAYKNYVWKGVMPAAGLPYDHSLRRSIHLPVH